MASASEEVRGGSDWLTLTASGWTITLHLYRPSGDFVCEHSVPVGMGLQVFYQALEEDLVTPELNLQQHDRYPFFNRFAGFDLLHRDIYSLVWKGMVLGDGTTLIQGRFFGPNLS